MTILFRFIFLLLLFPANFSLLHEAEAQDTTSLRSNTYSVPPQILTYLEGFLTPLPGSADSPFVSPSDEASNLQQEKSVQQLLSLAGVVFEEGASASFDPKTLKLKLTNSPEEIEKVEVLFDAVRASGEKQLHVYMEYIEVDHNEFSDWLFDNTMDTDGNILRNEVQSWIKAGRAEIIESATVTSRSGQRGKVESVDEYIYPTEYDPAEIPNKVVLKDGAVAPVTAVTPTAFETRNVGTTLEVDPVLGMDGVTVDLNLAPEIVKLEGVNHWHKKIRDPKFMTNMPTFYTMKITTQVATQNGRYTLLGSTRPLKPANPERGNPLVLQFVRVDVSSTGDWSKDEEQP